MGSTALYDAIGEGIDRLKTRHSYVPKEYRPDNVIFVIITDGQENASVKYAKANIKKQIEACQENGWKFIFLGSEFDAFDEATSIGINPSWTGYHTHTGTGVSDVYAALDCVTTATRNGTALKDISSAAAAVNATDLKGYTITSQS